MSISTGMKASAPVLRTSNHRFLISKGKEPKPSSWLAEWTQTIRAAGSVSRMVQYYDVDDILAENELVPAVFQEATNGVGLFDSSDEANRVEPGTKVELPFWLARELHLRQAVSANVPPCFNKKTREEIGADAAHVDLRNRSPYFYELGCKMVSLIGDKTIGSLLLVAFQTRFKDVLIKAHTTAPTVTLNLLSVLTNEETKLYEAAQSSTAAFKKWRMGGSRFQKASVLGRKRKSIGE